MTDSPLHIDLESRSTVDLKRTTVYRYAEDPTTDVWMACYCWHDAPEDVRIWWPGSPVPEDVREHIESGGDLYAWNTQFERIMTREILGPRYGWPMPALDQWHDPMVWAACISLPMQLAQCAQALGMGHEKDMEGHRLMMQMAKPRRIEDDGTIVWWDDTDRLHRLAEYCRQDVVVEWALSEKLIHMSVEERANWLLDQRINDRGVRVDLDLAAKAEKLADEHKAVLDAQLATVTGGEVTKCTQVSKLGQWLIEQGFPMQSLDKDAIDGALKGDLPGDVERALKIRREAAKSSVSKLQAAARAASADGRVRGLFRFHKAGTGRWAGAVLQPHNLPHGAKGATDDVCDDILTGDLDLVKTMWGSPLDAISSILRGCVVASPGKRLVCIDFSQIEARLTMYFAGQWDVVEVFAAGEDVYVYEAKKIGSSDRQLGKVVTLALGFGMGGRTFMETAEGYDIEMTLQQAEETKTLWRNQHQAVTRFWKALQGAATTAIRTGQVAEVTTGRDGTPNIVFKMWRKHLWCRLPSGRKLCYPYARLEEGQAPWDKEQMIEQITYWGIDSYTGKWSKQKTYGGKLCENVVQAGAADILRRALRIAEAMGADPVGHVHDEVWCEVGVDFCEDYLISLQDEITEPVDWAPGLPLAAEGFVTQRYRKD